MNSPTSGQESGAAEFSTAGTLIERMQIEILEQSVERVTGRMPVAHNTQPYGLLHGGASCVLAETLGSIAAMHHAQTHGKWAVGVDINATHHRSATAGHVTGTCTPIHLGRATTCHEIVIADTQDRRLCTARITCNLIDPR